MEKTKKFSISDIREVTTQESDEYSYARIKALSTMPNSHRCPISKEVLMKCGETALGSWIVCDYNQYTSDTTTHTEKQKIVGIVPRDSKIEYVEELDGNLSMVVDAVISKIYAKEIWDMFKKDNHRSVSCEFTAIEGEKLPNGDTPIEAFSIKGITILGKNVRPSCPNAEMEIYQFSEDDANKFYEEHTHTSIQKFAEERRKKMSDDNKNKKEDNMEEKEELKKLDEDETQDNDDNDNDNDEQDGNDEQEDNEETTEEMGCEKQFSYDVNLDIAAYNLMLENETEQYKELVNKAFESKDMNLIMASYLSMAKERDELKAFKEEKEEEARKFEEEKEKEAKKFEVEKTMAEVKDDLTVEKFEEMKANGMLCDTKSLDGWKNTVKAYAYEMSKSKPRENDGNNDTIKRFGFPKDTQVPSNDSIGSIFKKYL